MIKLAMSTKAETCIIPIQDYLGLGSKARINVPGVVSENNWSWRLKEIPWHLTHDIKHVTEEYNRG